MSEGPELRGILGVAYGVDTSGLDRVGLSIAVSQWVKVMTEGH